MKKSQEELRPWSKTLEFASFTDYLLALSPQASHLTSLCFDFLICKMGIVATKMKNASMPNVFRMANSVDKR